MIGDHSGELLPKNWISLEWIGKAVGVNEWHGARAIYSKKKGAWIAMVFESPRYREFKRSLTKAWEGAPKVRGTVDVAIYTELDGFDTDAVIKPVLDSLKGAVILDDRYVRNVLVHRGYHARGQEDAILVEVRPVPVPINRRTKLDELRKQHHKTLDT